MIVHYTNTTDAAGDQWLKHNLHWHIARPIDVRLNEYNALVVPKGWQSRFSDVQAVIRSSWNGMPIYMLTHTPSGFRLDHVHVDEPTLAMLHTAHANGYAVKAA